MFHEVLEHHRLIFFSLNYYSQVCPRCGAWVWLISLASWSIDNGCLLLSFFLFFSSLPWLHAICQTKPHTWSGLPPFLPSFRSPPRSSFFVIRKYFHISQEFGPKKYSALACGKVVATHDDASTLFAARRFKWWNILRICVLCVYFISEFILGLTAREYGHFILFNRISICTF